jgi:Holliday junction resolvasome RuvABC DNA-binding subunit
VEDIKNAAMKVLPLRNLNTQAKLQFKKTFKGTTREESTKVLEALGYTAESLKTAASIQEVDEDEESSDGDSDDDADGAIIKVEVEEDCA